MTAYAMSVPFPGPLHAQQDLIAAVEAGGYSGVWSAEATGEDGFTPLVLASTWAPTLRLGTAIIPAFTRAPALMAQSVASLCSAAPGRVALGLGTSSDVIVERWNGIPFEQPYRRVRDMTRFLREALAGEKISRSYDTFTVDGFRLGVKVDEPPKILIAALREGMLRLAGREGDGAIVNWLSPDDVPTVAGIVHDQQPGAEIVARLFVAPTDDREAVLREARYLLAAYVNVPVYRAFHEWMGRGDAFADHWARWAEGDRKGALEAIPDEMVDELVVHGTPEQCRRRIDEYVANGITTAALSILPFSGVDIPSAIRDLAPR